MTSVSINTNGLLIALRFFNTPGTTKATATQDLAWALINSAEFVFNH